MISRVAESCFWLFRNTERASYAARLLRVHAGMVLDVALPAERAWNPLLIVLGEEDRFVRAHGEEDTQDGEAVQEYLTWSPEAPISIVSAVGLARESARTIRETVSLEMWEALNGTWIWLQDGRGRRLYNRERAAFYEEVANRCHLFHGACQNTMLHEEPFDFMRLGLNLERAGQTARVLDLQHHALGPPSSDPESAVEAAEWIAILRACAAYEPFFKRRSARLVGPAVAGFLLLDPAFPGSVHHSLNRAWNFLRRIQPADAPGVGERSAELLARLLEDVAGLRMSEVLEKGIHEVLTGIVERTDEVSLAVRDDYFSGDLPLLSDPVPATPSQTP